MFGTYFCDVCSMEFEAESNDHRAECPGCKEDVLDVAGDYTEARDDEAASLRDLGLDTYEDAMDSE